MGQCTSEPSARRHTNDGIVFIPPGQAHPRQYPDRPAPYQGPPPPWAQRQQQPWPQQQQQQQQQPWPQGPPSMAPRQAWANRRNVQQQSVGVAPDVTEARTIVNQANLVKTSVRLLRRKRRPRSGEETTELTGPSASWKYRVAFTVDCKAACTATVFVNCEECGAKSGRVAFRPVDTYKRLCPLPVKNFPAGSGQTYASDDYIDFSQYLKLQRDGVYDLVVQLASVEASNPVAGGSTSPVPETRTPPHRRRRSSSRQSDGSAAGGGAVPSSPDSAGDSQSARKQTLQYQYTYCSVDREKGEISVVRQCLQVGNEVFEVEDIYGGCPEEDADAAADTGGAGGAAELGSLLALENTAECSICLSAPCDTLIMPCRHRCLCHECASLLREQSNKCPICRTRITGLLQRGTSPPPSPRTDGASADGVR